MHTANVRTMITEVMAYSMPTGSSQLQCSSLLVILSPVSSSGPCFDRALSWPTGCSCPRVFHAASRNEVTSATQRRCSGLL